MSDKEPKKTITCPCCGSDQILPAEKEYKDDANLWIVLAAVFILIGGAFVLFFFLQLHPVIIILLIIAASSWLLAPGSLRRKKTRPIEYICTDCEKRFDKREKDLKD